MICVVYDIDYDESVSLVSLYKDLALQDFELREIISKYFETS